MNRIVVRVFNNSVVFFFLICISKGFVVSLVLLCHAKPFFFCSSVAIVRFIVVFWVVSLILCRVDLNLLLLSLIQRVILCEACRGSRIIYVQLLSSNVNYVTCYSSNVNYVTLYVNYVTCSSNVNYVTCSSNVRSVLTCYFSFLTLTM